VLYELRGRDGYDDKHPDEYRRGHIPFLLLESGNPVGTVRFDLESEGHAVVRLVAVLPAHQRRGLGRAMMAALENVASERAVRQLKVHSAPDAVPFYEKLSWTMIDATADHPLMMKELPVT
jgi:GNAT superfamily N-acetyltransferase